MADAPSTIVTTPEQERLRGEVRELCARFPDSYWRERDRAREYPDAFVDALTEAGYLAVLIPAEYGGGGLGITEGSIVLEEINRSGGHSAGCHAQMYTMGALLKHGSEAQKQTYLPAIADGTLRLQAFSITEPEAGSDTTDIATTAVRDGDRLCDQRAQELDQPHRAVRPRAGAGPHHPARRRPGRTDPGDQPVPGRPARHPRASSPRRWR